MKYVAMARYATMYLIICLGLGCERQTINRQEVSVNDQAVDQDDDAEVMGEQTDRGAGSEEITDDSMTQPIRNIRRVSVDQLIRMIPVVTGGLRWIEDFGEGPVDILTLLSPTLGMPDYRSVTTEQLEPNLLMSKFLSDGAQRICLSWVARDRSAIPAEQTLVRYTNQEWETRDRALIRSNIARLLLRFFAYTADPVEGNLRVEALTELFETVAATSPDDPAGDGWFAVCIALMTDPEFTLY